MFSKTSALALFSLALAANANPTPQRSGNGLPCDPIHVIAARGSSDPYPGPQGSIINAICAEYPSGQCGYEDIVYPATFENYCSSVSAGARNGIQQITSYAQRCPDSKIVLTGFSQGGHVVGDILGGGGGQNVAGCAQQNSEGLDPNTAPGNRIVAALTFGDVRHTANQSYNTGTGANRNGIAPRSGAQLQSLNRFSAVLRTWCNANDPVCAGGSDGNAHGSYFDAVAREAAAWVKTKTGGTTTQPPTSGTPTSTPTPTQPPSCTAQRWAQCGGNGFTGCTNCVSGATCNKLNDWYSQCI